MIYFTAEDGALQIRRIPLDWLRVDQPYEVDLEVAADAAHSVALLACSLAWVGASLTGGAPFTPLGTDVQAGYDLGAFTAGQRKAVTLEVHIPPATEVRDQIIELYLGTGV